MTVTITITISDTSGVGEVSIGGSSGAITGPGESAGATPLPMLLGGPDGGTGEQAEESAVGPPPLPLEMLGLGGSSGIEAHTEAALPEDLEVMGEADASEEPGEPMEIEELDQAAKPDRGTRKKS